MIQALLIEEQRRRALPWATAAAEWGQGTGVLWLDLVAPTTEEMGEVAKLLSLHPTVVRACMHPEHRSRLKEFKGHLLLVLNSVGRAAQRKGDAPDAPGRWRTVELNLVAGERFLVSVHPEAVPAVSALWQRYLHSAEGRAAVEYLLYTLCDTVMSGYYTLLDRVDRYIDEAEEAIFREQTGQQTVDRLFALKRQILYLRRVLGPQRDAIGSLMRREFSFFPPDARSYFLDLYEHTLRLFDLLDTYRDLISSSLDAYLSTVSNRMNRIMQTLTIVSTIMLPLTLISGIFGMNFAWMPLVDSPYGFAALMLLMAGLTVALLAYFRRKKWM